MAADSLQLSILDLSDQSNLDALEKALYRAFSSSYIKTLYKIWNIDHKAKKISTKVSYEGQLVVVGKISERIVAGIAANLEIHNTLQLQMVDFDVNKSDNHFCEALYLFSLLDFTRGKNVLLSLSHYLLKYLLLKGITTIYGTCSQRRLNPYQMMGFSKIDEHVFEGEKKYLLKMNFPNSASNISTYLPM
jgi:hypothetical protein